MLRRKWDHPPEGHAVLHLVRVRVRESGGPGLAERLWLGGAGAQFVQITDKPTTWNQWQWLTPSSQAC